MITDINSEDRLVQATFAEYLHDVLGWDSVYARNQETFGVDGTLGRGSERDVILTRDLRQAITRLNPDLPDAAADEAVRKLSRYDQTRSTLQHNQEFYKWIRDGVPVTFRDATGNLKDDYAKVIGFRDISLNRFVAVRELKIQGVRVPHYNRRADLVCFVNGLPVVFIELKAVYRNIRAGYDGNLTDYFDTIPHAFYHNAFLVVSNGDKARYGSITSSWDHFHEWKRQDESEAGSLDAKVLLNGMLDRERLLDLFENFIIFDSSKPGATRKIVARNHQVLGVNRAVLSVANQKELKKAFPPGERLKYRTVEVDQIEDQGEDAAALRDDDHKSPANKQKLPLVERAHPDLGRLGVFWHTQGSGKSYSMIFFAEKVRRRIEGNYTFVVMTDREDLDDQIYRSFIGCGAASEKTPRASSGRDLQRLLKEDHRFIFSLMHKFNRNVTPDEPYSVRDDIIVISDEAHRTQSGKFARNMRLALPNAAFLGFTGTPLFKHDHLTRRIFGGYVSRYDFKRSEEDGATVKLVYENRGEKLGINRLDLNDRIAEAIEQAELDSDQVAKLENMLGKDYEIITADDRLDKVADDSVEHCSKRWGMGKSMVVCIDKVTCARLYQRIVPRWQAKIIEMDNLLACRRAEIDEAEDGDDRDRLEKTVDELAGRVAWMRETLIHVIVSEDQNEVKDFRKWGFDIRPHRGLIKRGFERDGGKRVDVESAFKDPEHPFRVAIVCAMWLTGFDVECLSTLYIDKPMKAHTLMQAIARANRVYPGKVCGTIVDYNGMLKSLRAALAQYALGDDEDGEGDAGHNGEGGTESGEGGNGELVDKLETLVTALAEAIEATEAHLVGLGFDPQRLNGAQGFERIEALRDAVDAVYTSDDARRRFEIMSRQVFSCFKALITEPAAYHYAERHDNIDTIYKKLQERRDTSDVTDVLKALHRIVNDAIQTQGHGTDHADGLAVDLSQVDFERLRDEFAKKVRRKRAALEDIRDLVEQKLLAMLRHNPERMDFYRRYQEIVADYNREKDRATVEETFARLTSLAESLDEEQRRAVAEGLTEDELALFDLLMKDDIAKTQREKLKQASRELLAKLQELLATMKQWTQNESTQADVEVFILDQLYAALPHPPFNDEDTQRLAARVYEYVWQRTSNGMPLSTAA